MTEESENKSEITGDEELPSPIEMVLFGIRVIWSEMQRIAKAAETGTLEIQEQKIFANHIEFLLKIHSNGVLEKLIPGKAGDAAPSAEDMGDMTKEQLAALTLEAGKILNIGLNFSTGTIDKVEHE